MHISKWGCDDVKKWLSSEGYEQYCQLLCDTHGVDGEVLLTLNEKDLRSPPLQLNKLSDIKKLGKSLKVLQAKFKIETCSNKKNILQRGDSEKTISGSNTATSSNGGLKSPPRSWVIEDSCDEYSSDFDDEGVQTFHDVDGIQSFDHSAIRKRVFLPEYKKLMVSFTYAFIASWITAYTMVLVHERVPDKEKYPPLPDIFLDNIPLIPYAFKLAELCGLLLASLFFLILLFHQHRTILLRRFFSITSTVFLLRSVTMFVTSLSVPGKHLSCTAMYNSEWQRIVRATEIVTGFGMSLTGVQTCGDYMFSGHTAYLTIFNHLITEYTPSKMYFIHTVAWVLHLFGLFFILAAHEHYSIDVFIAFYITSRIFLYYHMLANTRSYRHSKRIRIWFPLLSYFECNVPGKVPNEFEWPFTMEFALQFLSKAKDKLKKS